MSKMKTIFTHHGIAETASDNRRQFTSVKFQNFTKDLNFCHIASGHHYPQSNGETEGVANSAKEALPQKGHYLALLTYLGTPRLSLEVITTKLA